MELGGSAQPKQTVMTATGSMSFKLRDYHGIDPLTSQTYLYGLYCLQNDVYPGSLPTIYTMTNASGYNRSASITVLKIKAPAIGTNF